MKEKSDKINRFLLQEQFPDIIKVAGTEKRTSNSGGSKFSSAGTGSSSATPSTSSFPKHSVSRRIVTAVDHVTQLRLESCRCPQLEEYLPRILDLTVCRTRPSQRHPKGWTFANPVHALHLMASQSGVDSLAKAQKQRLPPAFLYGEEQHRTTALQTEGIAEYWCSFDGNSPDTAYAIQQQMDVTTSSKPAIKLAPKLIKDVPTREGQSISLTPLRSPSSTEANAAVPSGSKPQNLPTKATATSVKRIPPAQPVATALKQATPAVRPEGEGSAPIGASNHVSVASAGSEAEPSKQNSTTNVTDSASLSKSVTDPSIETGKVMVSKPESESPPSNPMPQNAKSNADVILSDSKVEEKDETKESSSNMVVRETGDNATSTGIPPIATSKTSPTSINLSRATKTSSEIGSTNDGSSDMPSDLKIAKKRENEETKAEPVKQEHSTSDSQSSQSEEANKDIIDGSHATSLDASSSSPVAATTAEAARSNGDEQVAQIETATKETITILAPQSKDEGSAVKNPNNKIHISGVDEPPSGKLTTGENKKEGEPDTTNEEEKKTANTNENQAEVKVDDVVMEKDNIRSSRIDSATKFESLSGDVAMGEGKNDEASKGSSPMQTTETEKVTRTSKIETSSDPVMQRNDTDPDITQAESNESKKDDSMDIEENIGVRDRVKESQKEGSVTESKQKLDVDSSSKGSSIDQIDAKRIKADPRASPILSHPPKVSKTATGAVVSESIANKAATTTQQNNQTLPQILTTSFKADPSMDRFRREEEKICRVRKSLMSKRVRKKPPDSSPKEVGKKRRRVSEKSHVIPGLKIPAGKDLNIGEEESFMSATNAANETVEGWIRQFRLCHESFWVERERPKGLQKQQNAFSLELDSTISKPCCQWCAAEEEAASICRRVKSSKKASRPFTGDELMQCLDCGFIGCSPHSLNSGTKQHMQQHLLASGHKFAVSCGEKAQLFCFEYGDYVYHEVFEQEKIRIACAKQIPHMAWKEHAILRSFDPFQFVKTPDSGILWRGLVATYPPMVPKEHFCAAQLTLRRKALFEGNSHENWFLPKPNALYFASSQHLKADEEKFKICAPVGIYNLGNTCFMSSILQCLVFCKPLQQYFLRDSGHHYKSCEVFRNKEDVLIAAAAAAGAAPTKKTTVKSKKPGQLSSITKTSKIESVCLACEMDRLFLSYYGGTVGNDVFVPIEESSQNLLSGHADVSPFFSPGEVVVPIEKGDPLIISDLLTSAWKSGGMNHLTGYDQHDAHEFLDSFLDVLGKHIMKFRNRIHSAVTKVYPENACVPVIDSKKIDIIKNVFEGSLRSVLLCENCGVKRVQQEPFMNISLSLSEEVERMQGGHGAPKCDLNVESCLQHFVLPEILGDLVFCTSCGKKTRTKKQHTFAKLPKVLCLHLKRFDASKNKKIENFVSFPSRGLNMGALLSHWCEVTRLGSSASDKDGSRPTAEPKILYDLFGTANHIGNMQSGHYVANVKVDDAWYHCNDQHVSYATEESVLKAEGAYVLFYIRR